MSRPHTQIQRAITQISEKAPVPEIDFTLHVLEDGTSVNTQERVIKDVRDLHPSPSFCMQKAYCVPLLGPGACNVSADKHSVLFKGGSIQTRHRLPPESLLY